MEQDDRFKHLVTDPKFRRIPKTERKIKIDKRFKSMFKDDKFKVTYTIDKRGRPVNHNSAEDLKRYYEIDSEDESSSSGDESDKINKNDDEVRKTPIPDKIKKKLKNLGVVSETKIDSEDESSSSDDESDKINKNESDEVDITPIPDKIKKKLKNLGVDYARGEAPLVSESSSDDDSDPETDSEGSVDHYWGELDKDASRTEEITNRLAVCNQDWDRIRAVDLMVLFTSFVPSGGIVESVTIYPSDFGIERLKQEEIKGPIELVEAAADGSGDEDETEEGSKYHMEKLRQYQLNRLKYYYAIVVCDSGTTANKIYEECDGMEYESSATKIDLRFVPADTEFDNDPKDRCHQIPDKYQPRFFTTTALQQAKVELTWDETDPERLEVSKKLSSGNIDDVTEADLQAYLASSSGESDDESSKSNADSDDDSNPIDKYRALLNDIEKTENDKDSKGVEMEITWGTSLKEKTEKLVKKKLTDLQQKTPFEQFLDKRKDKKKAKREARKSQKLNNSDDSDDDVDMNDPYFAEEFNSPEFKKPKPKTKKSEDSSQQETGELELLLLNDSDDTRQHFNLKTIQDEQNLSKTQKKKRKLNKGNEPEDTFELDVKDDRFSALYSSHHFNIDPTDPHYKKTKAMDQLVQEKLKRRQQQQNVQQQQQQPQQKKPKVEVDKKAAELSVLVKNIKRKTSKFGGKKIQEN